ncbi:hypothetical protein GHO25_08300 [Pseudomonas sp. FSL R10-1350]|uniref:hypothetical protein n=1 Tax=Pseudomonas sp. FSL R10-1350 TaxID=2662197 RepID=UPI001294AAA8|nr:hypothetical protein [Pseudomonas sp. FSL R10-1350]MQU63135.1 hypothetical protein [Pseudomonas sp. FSL R10-1350]
MGLNSHGNEELHEEIQNLVDEGLLEEGSKTHGIARHIADVGYDKVTDRQRHNFDQYVAPQLKSRKKQLEHQRIMGSNLE